LRPLQGQIIGVNGTTADQGGFNRRHIMVQRAEAVNGGSLR
jgi:hypothetical protein